MKKVLVVLLVIVVGVALIAWIISWFRAPEAVATSAAQPWPGEMGRLDAVTARFPPQEANAASGKLTALASALPRDEAVDEFVARESSRGELTIGDSPPLSEVSSIRELLLREPVIWERRGGIGGDDETQTRRALQMTMARALVASALAKARSNDPAAWEDLHAVWKLALSMEEHPQMLVQTAALSMVRMINAVAWKMPLPVPEWFGDLQEHDSMEQLLDAFQHQSAAYWEDGASMFPTKWLADSVEHDRMIAEELFGTTGCEVNVPMNKLGVDLRSVWARALRYRAEREATANALRLREGKPIEAGSRCSDGAWAFDGSTLRFSREIETAPPDRPMPLVLRVEP